MTTLSSHDNDWDEYLAASKVAIQKGRTMQDAFQRMCAAFQPHATLDMMNHSARHARNALLNAYNRLVRKARKKGIAV